MYSLSNEATAKWWIFGGRWQPFTVGHEAILQWILDQSIDSRCVLAIVNPNPSIPPDPDFDRFRIEDNPLTYWQRYRLLHLLAREHRFLDRVAITPVWHPRKSLIREGSYLPARRLRTWVVPLTDENETSKAADLRHLGESVRTVVTGPGLNRLDARSSLVRYRIGLGDEPRDLLPESVFHATMETLKGRADTPSSAGSLPIVPMRAQPPTRLHLELIERVLDDFGEIVVGLLDPDVPGEHDVERKAFWILSFWERLQLLRVSLVARSILDRVHIVPAWLPREGLDESASFLPGERIWVVGEERISSVDYASALLSCGEVVSRRKVGAASGSGMEVLRLAAAGDVSWKAHVPSEALGYLEALGFQERSMSIARRFSAEWARHLPQKQTESAQGELHLRALAALIGIRDYSARQVVRRTELLEHREDDEAPEIVKKLEDWRGVLGLATELIEESESGRVASPEGLDRFVANVNTLGRAHFRRTWREVT